MRVPECEQVEYSERVGYTFWVPLLIVILVVLYLAIMVGGILKGNWWFAAVFGAVTVSILLLYAGFAHLEFVITTNLVLFGFPLVNKSFERSKVILCEPYELTFGNYMGYGIRLGRDGTVAYNTRNGPGIKLVLADQKRAYVVSIDGAAGACEHLGFPPGAKAASPSGLK